MNLPTEEQINHLQSLLDAGTQGGWRSYWRENDEGHADCGVTASLREGMGHSVCRAPRFQKQSQWEIDGGLIAELHNAAPALLEAAREFNKLQELRKKWGGDDYGSLTTSQHFDCYCEDQAEELSEVKEENLQLREALEIISGHINIRGAHQEDGYVYLKRVAKEALGKESV